MIRRYEITDSEWKRIKDELSLEKTEKMTTGKNNRIMLNEMLWIAGTGAQRRELPERCEPWQTVYSGFRKWQETGIWKEIFHMLSGDADK